MTDLTVTSDVGDQPEEFELSFKQYLAFASIVLGVFLAMMDIQIVASSIGPLSVALEATMQEVAWVQSAYLVAEIIVIPITAWLTTVFSTRYLFLIAITGFMVMSIACAAAWDLPSMIVFRGLQGMTGGMMIPVVMSSIYIIFPPSKQAGALAAAGFTTLFSAISGPIIGGYITEMFSWHWLFLINAPIGVLVAIGVYLYVDFDEPDFSLLKKVDGWGILFIACCLASTEFVLKEGDKHDWMDSGLIAGLTVVALSTFAMLMHRELKVRDPVVNLRLFTQRDFAVGCVMSFSTGVVQFGTMYLLPAILASVRDFNSLEIGRTMMVMGLFLGVSFAVTGFLQSRVDRRLLMAVGFAFLTLGLWIDGDMTNQVGYWQLFWGQAFRGMGLAMTMLTITDYALGDLREADIRNGSGLYNLMRNLGGAFGLAFITWMVSVRQDLHYLRISERLTEGRLALDTAQLAPAPDAGFERHLNDTHQSQTALIETATQMAQGEALVMAYNDVWFSLFCLSAIISLLVFLVHKGENTGSPVPAH